MYGQAHVHERSCLHPSLLEFDKKKRSRLYCENMGKILTFLV